MRRSRTRAAVLLGFLVACAVPARPASAQKLSLRWKYQAGGEMVYRVSNHQEMDMSAMGGTMVSDQVQTQRWRVLEIAPGGDATIAVSTERVQVDVQSPAGNLKYDSQSGEPPTDPQTRAIAAMTQVNYTVVVRPDGTVRSVLGLAELREKMLASLPPDQLAMIQSMAGELFTEESITRMMQQSVQPFPAAPVSPADTWSDSSTMQVPVFGSLVTRMTFTLTGTERREGRTIANIAVAGQIGMGEGGASPLPVTFELGNSTMTGTIAFDVDRGLTLASSMSTAMQMTMTAAGQPMTMDMRNTVKLELVEHKPGR